MRLVLQYNETELSSNVQPVVQPLEAESVAAVKEVFRGAVSAALDCGQLRFDVLGRTYSVWDFLRSVHPDQLRALTQRAIVKGTAVPKVLEHYGRLYRYVAPKVLTLDEWFSPSNPAAPRALCGV